MLPSLAGLLQKVIFLIYLLTFSVKIRSSKEFEVDDKN